MEIIYEDIEQHKRFVVFGWDSFEYGSGFLPRESFDDFKESLDYIVNDRDSMYYELYDRIEGKSVNLDMYLNLFRDKFKSL